jgi:hypothetical protein
MLQIGLNVGEDASGKLGGLEPRIKWQTGGDVVGFDVEVRLNASQSCKKMLTES